jgi:hypothetical protein
MRRIRSGLHIVGRARREILSWALTVLLSLCASAGSASAETAYCADLRAQIAKADQGSGARYRAAGKQANELNRTVDYARRLGCDRQQFLFFGSPPPPQCGQINARIEQMRANLSALQQGDSNLKQSLVGRYDSYCRDRPTPAAARSAQRGFLEELFGAPQRQPAPRIREIPLEQELDTDTPSSLEDQPTEPVYEDGRAMGGSEAVCVRECDGGFFPINYSARRDNLDDLNTLCKALCPGAEASLYTKSLYKDIDSAVSINGDSYGDHPNAFKFQKTRDASCSCKPAGKNWAESLGEAESILAATHSKDSVVTEEQAEQLSRPAAAPKRAERQPARQDAKSRVETSTPETSAGAAQGQSVTREVTGPDGVKRRVRVVAPTL